MKGGGLSGPVGLAQALAQTALCNAELVLHRSWSLLVVTFGSGSQAMLNLPSHLSVSSIGPHDLQAPLSTGPSPVSLHLPLPDGAIVPAGTLRTFSL